MTRDEAIKRIANHMVIHRLQEPRAIKVTEALKMAIEALKQPEQEWIPISERLPKEGEIVQISYPAYTDVCGEEHEAGVGYGRLISSEHQYWCRSDGINIGELGSVPIDPIAWMPKPEPYKEESK